MVVILQDAALVFWMEYRRYVRTRRYWVLALTTLALGMLLCLIAALVAARIPEALLRFLGASVYLPAAIVGWFAAIASVVHNPLSVRMLQDVYKTRPLTDLYLTELHPLGVVLGRAAATTALTGLILLMLTPAGLWLLHLMGTPLGAGIPIALLVLVSYFFDSCLDAYTFRMLALGEEQFGPPQVVRSWFVSILSLGPLAGWVLASVAIFFPLWNWLARLPLWVFTPPTAPFLLFVGIQGDGWVHALLGALFAVGFALWVAFVLLAQAVSAAWWAYYSIYPTPLQGDYAHGYLLNTRGMRATLDQLISVSKSGLLWFLLMVPLLFLAKFLLSVAALWLSAPALAITIDWCLRLHPWYGVYQEWLGGNAWLYLPYSLAWALVLWVVRWRRGRQLGATAVRGLEWWRRHLERAPDETPKTVA